MKTFLLSCLLLFTSLNASETSGIFFKEASSLEASEIRQHLISYYSEQLVGAGLFEDLSKAIEAATAEWHEETVDNSNEELHYYHLVSNDSSTRYGYLVYSIAHRTAYLDAIYLEKAYRGQGLGKQTLQDFEAELKKKDIKAIKLYVFAHNIPAFTLYDKMGYLIETTYSDGNRLIGHLMKKICK